MTAQPVGSLPAVPWRMPTRLVPASVRSTGDEAVRAAAQAALTILEDLPGVLRATRDARLVTQDQAASEAGVCRDTWRYWERGQGKPNGQVVPLLLRWLATGPGAGALPPPRPVLPEAPPAGSLGQRLAAVRAARGLSLEQVGRELEVSHRTVAAWERGEWQPRLPRQSHLLAWLRRHEETP